MNRRRNEPLSYNTRRHTTDTTAQQRASELGRKLGAKEPIDQDGELHRGAEAVVVVADEDGRAPPHRDRARAGHHHAHLGAQAPRRQERRHPARAAGCRRYGAAGGEEEQEEEPRVAAQRAAHPRLRRRGQRDVAVQLRRAGVALQPLHPGPHVLRQVVDVQRRPVAGLPGGVRGGGAGAAGRGAVRRGRVQLRRHGGVQAGGGAAGAGAVAVRVRVGGGHDGRREQGDHGPARRGVVGRAADAGDAQGAQDAALHLHAQKDVVPGQVLQGLPQGDVHQQEGEDGASAGSANQQHGRQDPYVPTENNADLGRGGPGLRHRAGQEDERAAGGELLPVRRPEGGAPAPRRAAMRLQPPATEVARPRQLPVPDRRRRPDQDQQGQLKWSMGPDTICRPARVHMFS